MTTLATILGTVPIALALGAGAESRMSMGIAVIGGLVCGGALTLLVIPAMYVLIHRRASFAPTAADARRGVGDEGSRAKFPAPAVSAAPG